jgi:hypothetical protein
VSSSENRIFSPKKNNLLGELQVFFILIIIFFLSGTHQKEEKNNKIQMSSGDTDLVAMPTLKEEDVDEGLIKVINFLASSTRSFN